MISQSSPRSRTLLKRAFIAIGLGLVATFGLNVLAFFADGLEHPLLSSVLIWPNTFFQSLAPLHNIGTAERPIMEGTPLNFLAFVASIPLAWLVYSCIAYIWLHSRNRRSD